jgi:hypothetical protein
MCFYRKLRLNNPGIASSLNLTLALFVTYVTNTSVHVEIIAVDAGKR